MNEYEQFTLTLQPLKSDIPATVRIRAALKTLLRAYGLRCVRIGGPQDPKAFDPKPSRRTISDSGKDQ
jgi:hypothetical protein